MSQGRGRDVATQLFGAELVRLAERDGSTSVEAVASRWIAFVEGQRGRNFRQFQAAFTEWSATLSRGELLAVVRLVLHGTDHFFRQLN